MTIRECLSMQFVSRLLTIAAYFTFQTSAFAQPPRGADSEAADLLPKTIVACAEVSNLGGALETVLNHPLRAKLEAMPAFAAFMQSGQPKRLRESLPTRFGF